MSDLRISFILFGITALAGLICGFLGLYIFIPIFPGVVFGAIGGYFYDKHRFNKMYQEPYFFTLERLSFWGVIGGTFLCLASYQLVTWMIE